MTAFQSALALHFQTLLATAGQTIRYSNGSTVRIVKAVKTRPRAKQIDMDEGIILGSRNWEWLINQAELGFEPKLGHVITDADDLTYKVQPSNPNDLTYRPSDGQKTFIRVFTEEQ